MGNTIFSTPSQKRAPEKEGSFLPVHTNVMTSPIELSTNHFVVLHRQQFPIIAGSLAKGDVLVGADEMKPLEIIKIILEHKTFRNDRNTTAATMTPDNLVTTPKSCSGENSRESVRRIMDIDQENLA